MSWKWLVTVAAGLTILSACNKNPADTQAPEWQLDPGVERAEEVTIIYSDSARTRVRIEGPVMLTYLDNIDPKQEFPSGVRVDFFGPDEQVTSVLTARYGVRLEKKNQVVVRDSVVWKSIQRDTLVTEELIWDERSAKIYTNKFVVITRPDEILYGHGFEADQDFSNARINAVEGRIKVEDPGGKVQ